MALSGRSDSLRFTSAATRSSLIWRAAPGRGSSSSPSARSRAKRLRHFPAVCFFPTVCFETPCSAAIAVLLRPARLEEAVAAFDACLTVAIEVWPPGWVSGVRARRDEARAEIERRLAE